MTKEELAEIRERVQGSTIPFATQLYVDALELLAEVEELGIQRDIAEGAWKEEVRYSGKLELLLEQCAID